MENMARHGRLINEDGVDGLVTVFSRLVVRWKVKGDVVRFLS